MRETPRARPKRKKVQKVKIVVGLLGPHKRCRVRDRDQLTGSAVVIGGWILRHIM